MKGPRVVDRAAARRRVPGWFVGAIAIVICGGVLPLAAAWHYDALGIPRSDDWSYLVTLFRWVDDHRLGFNQWAATPLIGQLVVAAPVALLFRRSITAVQLLSTGIAVGGLLLVMVAGRRVVSDARAILVALTIAAGPLWMPLVPTFMTDHWAFAAQMAALACAFEWFVRPRRRMGWLVASVGIGFVAVSIRQYALVGVVAVLVAAWLDARSHGDRRGQGAVVALTAGFTAASAVLLLWWVGRPGVENLAPRVPDLASINATVTSVFGYTRLIGLLLAPVVVAAHPWRVARRAWAASGRWAAMLGGGTAVVLALAYVRAPKIPFVGNYVARSGVLGQDVMAGPRPDVVSAAVFDAMAWIGIASAAIIALRSVPFMCELPTRVRRFAHADPIGVVLALNLVGFALVSSVTVLVDLRAFDRYVLPVLPIVAFAVLRERVVVAPEDATERSAEGRALTLSFAAAALLAVVGLSFAADSASFDATRWKVARRAVAAGYTARQVDGGFEWVAWHRRRGPPYGPKYSPEEALRRRAAFRKRFCVRVAIAGESTPTDVVARGVVSAPTHADTTIVAFRIAGRCASH